MILRGLLNNSVRSVRLAVQSASNLRTLSKILTRLSIRAAHNAVDADASGNNTLSRFAQPLSTSRVFEGSFYPRQLFEDYLREVPGATLSHAVLAICGETMRRYLERHGEMGEGSLQALLEVNVRNAGAHALIGNRIAINQIELHTPIIFPVGRLQAIFTANPELQSIENAEFTSFRLRSLYENLPAPLLAWLGKMSNRRNSPYRAVMTEGNLGLAELKGSDKPLYFLGARLHGFTGISPLYSGCGLMFSASTHADNIGLTFTSDRNMLPDPEIMRACLDETIGELDSYLKSLKRKTTSTKPKARKPASTSAAIGTRKTMAA